MRWSKSVRVNIYPCTMASPSDYERAAWLDIQRFEGRPLTRGSRNIGGRMGSRATGLNKRASDYLDDYPRAQSTVSRGKEVATKSAQVVSAGTRAAADALPGWTGTAFESAQRTVGRISRVGLSPKRVVAIHRKRGHDVLSLLDLRSLDLEQIDAIGGRGASWGYPAAAAPSSAAVAGAFTGDAAFVLGVASRSVGHVSLLYGYDPETPAEKLFVMSVVNAGTAISTSAKTAAKTDVSRLTQALVRGRTWAVLNETVVAKVSVKFATAFGVRLTQQGLGKLVPAAGIVIGSTLNWATLEGIVDAADVAYRRRFLLEKYPHLADEEVSGWTSDIGPGAPNDADESISVLGELAEAGGPDIA